MPGEVKTQPASRPTSLQGAQFTFQSEADRVEAIDKAFDYRGDVTLTLTGEQVECYIFNRDAAARPPRVEGIDQAFHYRGDVTLTLHNEQIEGYMFNRDAKAVPPRIEIFVKGHDEARIIPYADVTAIAFTGKDTADGKSWDAWVSKKEHERQAEADRIKAEAEAQGHL